MFDPAKTFLLSRSDKLSVSDQARGRIAVVRIQAKDGHFQKSEVRDQGSDIRAQRPEGRSRHRDNERLGLPDNTAKHSTNFGTFGNQYLMLLR